MKEAQMIAAIILAVAIGVGVGYSYFTKTHDSVVEQVAEQVVDKEIETLMGAPEGSVHIDLSPSTPDK